jgi:hypothetical protein
MPVRLRVEAYPMNFSNDRTRNDPLLRALSEEQTAAWTRFYAIEADSRPGELEYDRALAAAKRLDAAVANIAAAGQRQPDSDWPF